MAQQYTSPTINISDGDTTTHDTDNVNTSISNIVSAEVRWRGEGTSPLTREPFVRGDVSGTYTPVANTMSTDSFPNGASWNDDGTKVYIASGDDPNLTSYSLSTPYDISTATKLNTFNPGTTTQDYIVEGFIWSNDGKTAFGTNVGDIREYSAGTAFDITTLTEETVVDVSFDIDPNPEILDIRFNGDGTKLFIADRNDQILDHTLSTAYDLNTINASPNYTFSKAVRSLSFTNNGANAWVAGGNGVSEYALSTSYDFSSRSLQGTHDYSIIENNWFLWDDDGDKIFVDEGTQFDAYTPFILPSIFDIPDGQWSRWINLSGLSVGVNDFTHSINGSNVADFEFRYTYETNPTPVEIAKVHVDGTTYELPLVDPSDNALQYSSVRAYVNGQVLAADLVGTGDSDASPVRIYTPQHGTVSWRRNI